jgi:hypothetical protein
MKNTLRQRRISGILTAWPKRQEVLIAWNSYVKATSQTNSLTWYYMAYLLKTLYIRDTHSDLIHILFSRHFILKLDLVFIITNGYHNLIHYLDLI